VTGFTFDRCDRQHILQVQDVGVEVRTVYPIRDVAGQVRQIGVPNVFLDLNVLDRKAIDLRVNALGRAILIPAPSRHCTDLHLRRAGAGCLFATTG
jgi:hypothetical protein